MSLARIRGLRKDPQAQIVEDDLEEIMVRIRMEENSGTGTWLECFTGVDGIPKLAYRTYMMMTLQALQQLTGANYFFYVSLLYFTTINVCMVLTCLSSSMVLPSFSLLACPTALSLR